jgi:hypothetical protein
VEISKGCPILENGGSVEVRPVEQLKNAGGSRPLSARLEIRVPRQEIAENDVRRRAARTS